MEPIILTRFGETLLKYPNSNCTDENKISSCIGVHYMCGGWIDLKPISETYYAVKCRACGLRVEVPKEIDTYGKLRKWLGEKILKEELRDKFLSRFDQ